MANPFVTVNQRTRKTLPKVYQTFLGAYSIKSEDERTRVGADAVMDAAESLKFLMWYPEKAKGTELETLRTACDIGRGYCVTLADADPLRLPEKFPKLTEEAGADALEAVLRIRQVIALDGDDSRTHWLDPMVNVDRIPAIARGFLWPNAFTPVDEKESKKPLSGLSRRMLEAVKHSRNKDDRALLGFSADKLREAGFFLFALSLALPKPRSQTGEGYVNCINARRDLF